MPEFLIYKQLPPVQAKGECVANLKLVGTLRADTAGEAMWLAIERGLALAPVVGPAE